MSPPPPLTVAEVARRRRVSADVVYGWIESGELVATNEGAGKSRPTWRVEEADLAAFLAARRTRPEPTAARRSARRLPELATATRYFR